MLAIGLVAMVVLGASSHLAAEERKVTEQAACVHTLGCEAAAAPAPDGAPPLSLDAALGTAPVEKDALAHAWDFVQGFVVDGAWGTVTGVWEVVTHPVETLTAVVQMADQLNRLTRGDPMAALYFHDLGTAMWDGVAASWNEDPYRFSGRVVFEIVTLPIGQLKLTKATKLATATKVIDRAQDMAAPRRAAGALPDVAKLERAEVPRAPELFARGPVHPDKPLPPNYHGNAIAAAEDFVEWFERSERVTGRELLEQTRRMHRTSARGRDGSTPYEGYENVPPGQLLMDTGGVGPGWISPDATAYGSKVAESLDITIDPPAPGTSRAIRVAGIADEAASPRLFMIADPDGGAPLPAYRYATSRAVDRYFDGAAELATEIRRAPRGLTPEVADAIADYYHTLSATHAFHSINNSVFMNQVNSMLRWHGHAGISHGHLDYLAHQMDHTAFREVFRAQLEGRLPPASQWGLSPSVGGANTPRAQFSVLQETIARHEDWVRDRVPPRPGAGEADGR